MGKVIVIAGTSDGRQIIQELAGMNISVAATVTTEFGNELLEKCTNVEVHVGKLTSGDMVRLIEEVGAPCLVDASHPYAKAASENAITACRQADIPYLRYERKEAEIESGKVIEADSFEDAVEKLSAFKGNIFLTIGSNNLEVFVNGIKDFKERLYARVLPDSGVMLKCERLGLGANNILAVKGPFSGGMNLEMLKHCKAEIMVTKDSGEAGGTAEKLDAAFKLGIPVILVKRPEVSYGNKVSSVDEVIGFVKQYAVVEV